MMKSRRRFLEGVGATGIAVTVAGSSAQQQQIDDKYPLREIRLDRERCFLWASTSLHIWPEKYLLVSLPTSSLPQAANIVSRCAETFAALVMERDEVSLTVPEQVWRTQQLKASAQDGPYRVVTLDLSLNLDVFGYFAPAAVALANAGISIVPQSAYLKDHVVVHEKDLKTTVTVLEKLIEDCRSAAKGR